MGRLEGRVALITGAASGIGEGIAREYAREGASVIIADINAARAEKVASEIEEEGGVARSCGSIDVSNYEQMEALHEQVVDEWGRLNVLVNNAGIGVYSDFLESTLEDWRKVLTVNLDGVYIASRLFADIMTKQMGGRIVNISSVEAFMTSGKVAAYNAAKAGVLGLTRAMAVELAPYNIIVNAICPGAIRTKLSMGLGAGKELEKAEEEFREHYLKRRRIPLARVGQPEDVAGTALFLASEDCRYMTGQMLVVDGGLSLTL